MRLSMKTMEYTYPQGIYRLPISRLYLRNFPDFNESRNSAVNAFHYVRIPPLNPDRASALRSAIANLINNFESQVVLFNWCVLKNINKSRILYISPQRAGSFGLSLDLPTNRRVSRLRGLLARRGRPRTRSRASRGRRCSGWCPSDSLRIASPGRRGGGPSACRTYSRRCRPSRRAIS